MFGIVGILVVGYVAKTMLAGQERPAAPTMRDVPSAIADISPGTVITEGHLGMVKIPRDRLEANLGTGTVCSPGACSAVLGACCAGGFPNLCTDGFNLDGCERLNGTFLGLGSTCTGTPGQCLAVRM